MVINFSCRSTCRLTSSKPIDSSDEPGCVLGVMGVPDGIVTMVHEHADANSGARIALTGNITLI